MSQIMSGLGRRKKKPAPDPRWLRGFFQVLQEVACKRLLRVDAGKSPAALIKVPESEEEWRGHNPNCLRSSVKFPQSSDGLGSHVICWCTSTVFYQDQKLKGNLSPPKSKVTSGAYTGLQNSVDKPLMLASFFRVEDMIRSSYRRGHLYPTDRLGNFRQAQLLPLIRLAPGRIHLQLDVMYGDIRWLSPEAFTTADMAGCSQVLLMQGLTQSSLRSTFTEKDIFGVFISEVANLVCQCLLSCTQVSVSLSCTPSVSVIILYPSVSVIILYPKCQCHYPVPQVVSVIILYPKCQCHYPVPKCQCHCPVPQVSVSLSCTPSQTPQLRIWKE
ncbi:unnamed protein product [Ranitomeya imitator]|uniref:Uncharacterized protein n=1 Tax=Ranitomeya imitator TaxID=111125 RepID=A0ABN9LZP6_9NEOB|nr:unnamed protein product [Ranitomeya imitator]